MTDNEKFNKINLAIGHFFNKSPLSYCKPKDLMPLLIKQNLFKKDFRNGLPLRNLLRKWDNTIDLKDYIPSIRIERKKKNRFWFFDRI
jgi:hypothetical protein